MLCLSSERPVPSLLCFLREDGAQAVWRTRYDFSAWKRNPGPKGIDNQNVHRIRIKNARRGTCAEILRISLNTACELLACTPTADPHREGIKSPSGQRSVVGVASACWGGPQP